MVTAFDRLGIPPCLTLSDETLREAFRAAGKLNHPDAGGAEGEFTALNEAYAALSSPSRRLQLWLESRGLKPETRGTIDAALMDLFSDVGAVTQRAESLIRKRDEIKFALVRAMLEGQTQICREDLEKAIARVESWINRECEIFPELEKSETPDLETASKVARNLVFLEKWRAGLRSCFARLV
ncbi:MAG: J domain-containing protein [Luteolibacter sp.]